MKTVVIGAAGFVGRHLLECLREEGAELYATKLPAERLCFEGAQVFDLDVMDEAATRALLLRIGPDAVVHLAAQSSIRLSWKNPEQTLSINVLGALHVMDALRHLPAPPRLLLVGSGEEYGLAARGDEPIPEESALCPGNIYAVSKATQTMLGVLYARAYGLPIVCARPFNHIGPGQSESFVVPHFCRQLRRIERGEQEPVLRVGNLEIRRDFTDVRDVARAYALLLEKGRPGEIYNVGSGRSVSIRQVLDALLSCLPGREITVRVEKDAFRPVDVPCIRADIQKLQRDTGWAPRIGLEQSLSDTLRACLEEA